jgi:hypothetical protein
MIKLGLISTLLSLCLLACGGEPSVSAPTRSDALSGGCRLVCPKCEPNKPCEMWACYDDCNAADPKSCVDNVLCPIGYSWSPHACSCEKNKH